MKKYIERLLTEWEQHSKIIIAVDFDDTIFNWKMNDYETYSRVIKLLQKCKETGAYIVIFTCSNKDRHGEIEKFCNVNNLKIDGINQNPIDLPYGNEGKIYANIFLDDRAGLDEALDILEKTMYIVRGRRNTQSTLEQKF